MRVMLFLNCHLSAFRPNHHWPFQNVIGIMRPDRPFCVWGVYDISTCRMTYHPPSVWKTTVSGIFWNRSTKRSLKWTVRWNVLFQMTWDLQTLILRALFWKMTPINSMVSWSKLFTKSSILGDIFGHSFRDILRWKGPFRDTSLLYLLAF